MKEENRLYYVATRILFIILILYYLNVQQDIQDEDETTPPLRYICVFFHLFRSNKFVQKYKINRKELFKENNSQDSTANPINFIILVIISMKY